MILSKTTGYALRILIRMAAEEQRSFSATELHEILSIKQQYLRRILTDLARKNFIDSYRGRSGGYVLARPAANVTVAEVIDAIEGLSPLEGCILGVENCRQQPMCGLHCIWTEARAGMMNAFRRTTLADINKTGNAST